MASIVKEILRVTLGLVVNKGRNLAAEKLKDGDVTDQQFRNLIARELDDIKSKIDVSWRKDLLASVSLLKEGLVYLYQLLDQPELRKFDTERQSDEDEKPTVSFQSVSVSVKTISQVEQLKMLKLNELSEESKQILASAKKRFHEAQFEATKAFVNEALKLSDRLLAMKILIMAILMEDAGSPSATALASCKLRLEELHNLIAVQNCFVEEVNKLPTSFLYKNERCEVIADVCHMNFVVYSVTRMVGGDWLSYKNIGKLKIDPLRDRRLIKTLKDCSFNLERSFLLWTFGREGEVKHRLDRPWGITTNAQGQFIVADNISVKVFDPLGKFLCFLHLLTEEEQEQLKFDVWNVATDTEDYLYVLSLLWQGSTLKWRGVYVFDRHHNMHHKFPLRKGFLLSQFPSLTVNNDGQVFVPVKCDGTYQVDVYGTDGTFVHSFGQGILSKEGDITTDSTAHLERIMILDGETHSVYVFNTKGDHLYKFSVQEDTVCGASAVAFHQLSQHVIVSSWNPDNEDRGQVSIYTTDGDFVRSVHLDTDRKPWLLGLTTTVDGRIAVTNYRENKVHIIP